jgi:hypothetical protein
LQNIDPVYFLIPFTTIGFSIGLVLYWHFKRRLTGRILLYALLAYAGAIILKYAVQIPTIDAFSSAVGHDPAAMGIYYGIQTSVFEIGGAYVVAYYALRRNQLKAEDAGGYGISLAFWENGVILGIIMGATALINLATYYAILSSGTNGLSQSVYNALSNSTTGAPGLFYPPANALPNIGFAILERISSLLAHFSWGYLVVFSVVFRRRLYLWIALPMGFIDFSVPFASHLGTAVYEFLIFGISIVFLIIALTVTRTELSEKIDEPEESATKSAIRPESLMYINFKRALNYGKLYLIIAIVISVLYGSLLTTLLHGAGTSSTSAAGISSSGFSQIPVILLPVFAVIGSFGGLMVFVSDKDKGVYEYLIAYGVEPSNIFWSIVVASFGLVSVILTISVSSSVIIQLLSHISITPSYVELIFFYVIPISYTATAFGNMAGMIWSALTRRRVGINSPVGLAPILGIIPMLIVLLLSGFVGPGAFILLVGSVSGAALLLVIVMVGIANQRMSRERFLSSEQ